MLTKVKMALRVSSSDYDTEISSLIASAQQDLALAGVVLPTTPASDDLIVTAVTTYVRAHFGSPDNYTNLKNSYDEQKSQLMVAEDYRGTSND